MNIFVGGSLREVEVEPELCRQFVNCLGEQIIERGHTLLTGCRGSMDKAIAESADRACQRKKMDPHRHLISYRLKNAERGHEKGRIRISRLTDWELTHVDLNPPEQIAEADVALFIAGGRGTLHAANWARIAEKPVLGVALFGGSGARLYERERDRFKKRYAQFVAAEDFDVLSEDTRDCARLARDVVALCERVQTPNTVFTIMPFRKEFDEVFARYEKVCKQFGFKAERTDLSESSQRIIPRILDGIRHSAFVIADVTGITEQAAPGNASQSSANVYYEIGFAEGLGRPVIVTADEQTDLPFDLADIPVLKWRDHDDLESRLERRVEHVAANLRGGRGAE